MKEDTLLENLFRRISFNDDQEAFKDLFLDFYPSLCLLARRYISSPETCEDIVQDLFFKLWKNRKKIEITSSFRNLLITSLINSCKDFLRKQSVRSCYTESQSTSEITDNSDTPETIYTVLELEDMLQSAFDRLPENVVRAFKLSRFNKMTYTQIADEMCISTKTVEFYISKTLKMLREELREYLPLILFFIVS